MEVLSLENVEGISPQNEGRLWVPIVFVDCVYYTHSGKLT